VFLTPLSGHPRPGLGRSEADTFPHRFFSFPSSRYNLSVASKLIISVSGWDAVNCARFSTRTFWTRGLPWIQREKRVLNRIYSSEIFVPGRILKYQNRFHGLVENYVCLLRRWSQIWLSLRVIRAAQTFRSSLLPLTVNDKVTFY